MLQAAAKHSSSGSRHVQSFDLSAQASVYMHAAISCNGEGLVDLCAHTHTCTIALHYTQRHQREQGTKEGKAAWHALRPSCTRRQ